MLVQADFFEEEGNTEDAQQARHAARGFFDLADRIEADLAAKDAAIRMLREAAEPLVDALQRHITEPNISRKIDDLQHALFTTQGGH